MSEATRPVCLTIAGLDPSGGAGILADVRTFGALHCFAAAAITSVTFQNTTGVFGDAHQTGNDVRRQIEPVLDDLDIAAVKIGMLPTVEIVETVADIIRSRALRNVVVDPVLRLTSGHDLIDDAAIGVLVELLFPLAELVTPNIPEAERIAGVAIESEEDVRDAAALIREMGARNVLIKGGHVFEKGRKGEGENGRLAIDHLFIGPESRQFSDDRIEVGTVHGTGCVLSSAIAANLAFGLDLADAVASAKRFVTDAIRNASQLGHGSLTLDF